MSKRLGLVIGNSVYRDKTLAQLATPDVDVGDLADVLLDPEVGGFDDVKVVVNTSTAIARRAISDFFSVKNRDDLLLLYFSCHGVLDENGRLYLAFKDTERQLLRATSIPAAFITEEMNTSRSQRQVLILDCCHSGAFARGTKGASGASVGTAAAFEGTGYGRVVLTATDATQYAWEDDQTTGEAVNSIFTRYLVQGLQSGEADANNDGRITIDELYDYIYARVVKQTPKQTPGKWSYKEQGEVVIAQSTRRLILTEPVRPAPELDEDLEQRLARLYTRGLSAYWLEEWDKAESAFQAITEIQPNYRDTASKLPEVKRQKKLVDLYQRALADGDAHNWDGVITALETLEQESAGYKDTAARLAEAKRQKHLADLYAQAQQLFEARQWQAVVKVFANIDSIEKDYPDPAGLFTLAKREIEAFNRQKELEVHYNRAFLEMDAGKWQEARRELLLVQEIEPGYGETERLLARVEAELARQQQPAPPQQVPPAEEELVREDTQASRGAETAQFATTAKGIGSPLDWIRDLKVTQDLLNPEKLQIPVTGEGEPLLPEKSLWLILMVAAGWFFVGFIHYWQAPDSLIESVKSSSGYSLDWDYALLLIRLIIFSVPAGLIFWLFLRSLPLSLTWKHGLILIGGFSLASALTVVILNRAWNIALIGWMFSFTLGGFLAGLAAGWVIRQARPSTTMKQVWWIVAGSALGSGLAGVLAFFGMAEGLAFAATLGSGIAGLLLAGTVMDQLSAPDRRSVPWSRVPWSRVHWNTVLAGAAGFFLAELAVYFLAGSPDPYSDSFYLSAAFAGAIGGAFLGLPSRNSSYIILLSALGFTGLLLGQWIGMRLYSSSENALYLVYFWGFGIGLAVGLSTRSLPRAFILTLVGMGAAGISFELILLLSDGDPGPVMIALAWGVTGGILALGLSFLGREIPVKRVAEDAATP